MTGFLCILAALIAGFFSRDALANVLDWKMRRDADKEQRHRWRLAMCPDGCLLVADEVKS